MVRCGADQSDTETTPCRSPSLSTAVSRLKGLRAWGAESESDMGSQENTYVLLTPVYNEEAHIEETIRSVASQTVLPRKWVIISDGSTDGTDEIVKRHLPSYDFIRFVRREKDQNRGFASKVAALRVGAQFLGSCEDPFVGHLDGDQSFNRSYFESLLDEFRKDPRLGIGGGWIAVKTAGDFRPRRENSPESVCGGIQMFRRECYRDVGDLPPFEYGGEDWYAEVRARMFGWRVRSFPELEVRALRSAGERDGARLRYRFREGYMDFALGTHPAFEVAKIIRRIPVRPYLFGALARLFGFAKASVAGRRMVPKEFIAFLRQEQMGRLRERCL